MAVAITREMEVREAKPEMVVRGEKVEPSIAKMVDVVGVGEEQKGEQTVNVPPREEKREAEDVVEMRAEGEHPAQTSAMFGVRSTATRHLGAVVGLSQANRIMVVNLLSDARAAAECVLGAIEDAAVRDVSRFGEADLMRAFCSV